MIEVLDTIEVSQIENGDYVRVEHDGEIHDIRVDSVTDDGDTIIVHGVSDNSGDYETFSLDPSAPADILGA